MAALAFADTLRDLAKTFVDSADRVVPCNDNGDLESMLENLESTVYRALCDIREALNSLRPINCIPPELLARVLSLLPERQATKFGHWESWPHRFKTFSQYDVPTSVCRHWHNTALDTPTLWADICIVGKQVYNYSNVHQRFPHCPLSLFIERHDGPWGPRAINIMRSHGPHIRLLHLRIEDCDNKYGRKALRTIYSLPAQELRHCALMLHKVRSEKPSMGLFSGHGESLRSLLLSGLPFLPSNTFPALRRLILFAPTSANWDMTDLLTFLSRLPSLERCSLSITNNTQKRVVSDLPSISLNALRTLSIATSSAVFEGSMTIIRDLYTHVDLPNVVHNTVEMRRIKDLPAFESYLIPPSGASYTALMVHTSSYMTHELKFGRRDSTRTLSFRYSLSALQDIKSLLSTSPPLNFQAVREYWLMAFQNVHHGLIEEWLAALPFLPNLRGLVAAVTARYPYFVGWGTRHATVQYLTPTPDVPAQCQQLETLCLCIHGLNKEREENRDNLFLTFAEISHMLRSRSEAGCPIRQVILGFAWETDSAMEERLLEMKGLVDELVWFWDVGMDFDWLRLVPSLLLPSSPIHVGWADTNVEWTDED